MFELLTVDCVSFYTFLFNNIVVPDAQQLFLKSPCGNQHTILRLITMSPYPNP